MKRNGQLLSLDFLFAMALVFLAIGIAIKFGEISAFEWQEKQEQMELEQYGRTAAFLLMGSSANNCSMKDLDGNPLAPVNNCIDSSKTISNASLGLPSNYEFGVFNQTDSAFISPNNVPGYFDPNVFSLALQAVVSNGMIPKADLYKCLQKRDDCALEEKTIVLTVWKP